MELNEKLSQLRKKKGLTQLELAEALNVSRQAVSRWEVGTAVPTLDNLVNLSEVYAVPLDELVHGESISTRSGRKPASRLRTLAAALCLVVAGALIATVVFKLYRDYQVRKAVERAVVVDIDGTHILTDNPEKFQNNPDEPRSYKMNPDGTCEEYSLADEFSSLLDRAK